MKLTTSRLTTKPIAVQMLRPDILNFLKMGCKKGLWGTSIWRPNKPSPLIRIFYTLSRIGSMLFCYYPLTCQPLNNMNTSAAVPELNRSNVYCLEFPCPVPGLISVFDDVAGCFWKRQVATLDKSATLVQVRDLLLPNLMSGEVHTDEAKKVAVVAT